MKRCRLLKTIMFLLATVVWQSWCCPALRAGDLTIAFPAHLPPWTLQKEDTGITVEIVRRSLRNSGYQVLTTYITLKQLNRSMAAGIDAHAQVESRRMNGHYSEKFMDFQTSLVSLAPMGLSVHAIGELSAHRIIAFENAARLFGKDFEAMARENRNYAEMADQERQVAALYDGLTDLILIDRSIFLYFRKITALTNTSMPVTYHEVPGLTIKAPAFVVFRDKALCDAFNDGLRQLKATGDYYDIFYKYTR